MCGIAGVVDFDGGPVREEQIRAMCGALSHRGPDGGGLYLAPGVGLGMRRLSIIDLQTGAQPVRNEDGSAWVVFNGEIYNYRDLRPDLEGRGHRFYTSSDTESIVHLYEDRGRACVEALRGMFAFAIWDRKRRTLLLARDRLGIKPLFYTEIGRRLAFASELKALLQLPEVEARIDWRALGSLLSTLHTPSDQSIVAGVKKLEPGHVLVAEAGRAVRLERYWDVRFEPERGRSEAAVADELRGVLEESVRLHLVSDVPIGAFLSGGVDSSSVVALMSRANASPVKTFSIGFRDADFDETPNARLVAGVLGTDHHEEILEPDAAGVLEDVAYHLDEPFGDSSAIPTYMVSRLAARHVKVALSGDGGDELFAGYDRYLTEERDRRFGPLQRWVMGRLGRLWPRGVRGRNRLLLLSMPAGRRYLSRMTLYETDEKRQLLRPDAFEEVARHDPWSSEVERLSRGGHWLSRLQDVDLMSYLPHDILTKVDRMSMAHSLEARVPLLDHKVVEFASKIPPEMQLSRGRSKRVLKRAMAGLLPESVFERPKRGFAIPLGRWFRGPLKDFPRDLLLSERSRRRGIFDTAAVERLLDDPGRGGALDLPVWTLLSFELWCRAFLDQRPREAVPSPGDARPAASVRMNEACRAGIA
jgi:asparagine synthase (glutamine-hydrolysing)